ncbi:MAG: hypothetical protein Q4D57_02220 [Clostridia bacterium]|nr:hypothetical protein [Clostridia bacterium]
MDKEILTALEDNEFAEKILDCISPEEVQGYFEEMGINVTDEDANVILCSVYGIEGEAAFANDYDLELVAGGKSDDENKPPKGADSDVVEVLMNSVGAEKLAKKMNEKDKCNQIAIRYGAPKIEKTDK